MVSRVIINGLAFLGLALILKPNFMADEYIKTLDDLKEYLAQFIHVDEAFEAMRRVSVRQDVSKWFEENYGYEGIKRRTGKQAFTLFFTDLKTGKI